MVIQWEGINLNSIEIAVIHDQLYHIKSLHLSGYKVERIFSSLQTQLKGRCSCYI
jgi:hypothetical protein